MLMILTISIWCHICMSSWAKCNKIIIQQNYSITFKLLIAEQNLTLINVVWTRSSGYMYSQFKEEFDQNKCWFCYNIGCCKRISNMAILQCTCMLSSRANYIVYLFGKLFNIILATGKVLGIVTSMQLTSIVRIASTSYHNDGVFIGVL